MASLQEVELGFVEKPEDPSLLKDPFFPSKVGGKPAWLDLRALPSPEKLACISCGRPSVFLLQIYAPLAHLNPQAFHRSVFIFMCRDPSCHQNVGRKAFKVFRLQLPKTNNCTDSEKNKSVATERLPEATDPEGQEEATVGAIQAEAATLPETSAQARSKLCDAEVKLKPSPPVTPQGMPSLCVVCGCLGPKKCGKCKRANYCSREHQIHDWKAGHKLYCSDIAAGKLDKDSDMKYIPSAGVLLPEFEIVTEAEPEHPVEEEKERSENERMEDYFKFVKSGKYKEIAVDDKAEKVMEKAKSDLTSDKYFKAFKKRVAMEPEQVLRYQRGGQPLLVSGDDIPIDIPECNCGANRVFEFQVMPQLLYYLKLDSVSDQSIDWGTLMVYTCTASCTSSTGNREEYIWKQDFSP